MGDVNIKSENQSGGITAQNVNSGNENSVSVNEKEGSTKTLFWWIFGLLGAASAIVAIVKYF